MSRFSQAMARVSGTKQLLARRRRARNRNSQRTLLLEQLEQRSVLSADGLASTIDPPALTEAAHEPASILVRFRPGAAASDPGRIAPGAAHGRAFSSVPGLREIKLGHGLSVEQALDAFRHNPNVLYAQPNFRVHTQVSPSDPAYPLLYGMHNEGQTGGLADSDIDAPEAWDITTGDGSIVVGVIDTGIDYTHPDLAANIWTNPGEVPGDGIDNDGNGYPDDVHGYNFVSYNGNSLDDHFHGTHVAGTIGAAGNNGEGVVGVNWNVKLMSLKFLDAYGSGWTADAIAAVDYATTMRNLWVASGGTRGANIRLTSNSWGGGPYDQGLLDAIDAGGAAGVLFVAAAGNSGVNADFSPMYPAAYGSDNIISVAATDASDNIAYFSNFGLDTVDLAAPGVNTYSTFPTYLTEEMYYNGFNTHYESISGTSMATPHVSGVAALAWSLNPAATVADIRNAILASVDPIASVAVDGFTPVATGGRLNAYKTLQAVGMAVAGSTPAAGSIIATQPTDFVINFSHSYDASTVDASDLTVNGIPAASRTLLDNTVTFHFAISPVTAEGLQTMHVAGGAIDADPSTPLPDRAIHEWTGTFRYDLVRLEVASTNPNGPLAGVPLTTFDVNWNEPVDPLSASAGDLVLSQGTVTDVEVLPGNTTVRFTLSGIESEGSLSASLAAGALTDASGNPSLPFARNYTLVTSMGVGGSLPAAGVIVGAQPAEFVLDFTLPFNTDPTKGNVLDAADLTVNGVAASTLVINDADTATFRFASPPAPPSIEGVWTMHMNAGVVDAAPGSGLPDPRNIAWTAGFRYDATPLTISTAPAAGSAVQLPLSTFDVLLNEPVDPSSVSTSDLALSQGTVTALEVLPDRRTIRFTLGGITTEGTLEASIAAGALTDGFGNPNLAFAGSYTLDIGTIPYPTPLAAIAPLGSLIYDPSFSAILDSATDTDSFTIAVDAGQTITVVVDPNAELRPTIELRNPSNVVVGTVTASGPGKEAVLQTIAVGPANAGTYTIKVGSAVGSGSYAVQVFLNAALELESHDGAANNSPVTAQNISGSFIPLLKGATRGAVLGQTDPNEPVTTVFAATFEGGSDGFTTSGLWHRSIGHGAESGHSFEHSLYFGTGEKYAKKGNRPPTFTAGTYEVRSKGKAQTAAGSSTSPLINLPAGGQISLDFNYILQTDGKSGQDDAKLQILSAAGAVLREFKYDDVAESSTWRAANPVDLSAYSGQSIRLRFDFNTVNSNDNNHEGWYVDDVRIVHRTEHDHYSFTAAANQNVTVVLDALSGGDINVVLRSAAGAVLATGAGGAINADKMIYNFDLPAAGDYQLAITGQVNTSYSLVVTLGAVFDRELNNSFDTAQSMDGVVGSLGYLGVEGRVGYFTDFNEFSTGPAAAIVQAGLTPVQITDIGSFDLSTIDVLLVNESNNEGLSSALAGRLSAIQAWVQAGGVFMVHDRFVSDDFNDPQPNPFLLGQGGILVDRDFSFGPDLDVIPPGSTLVTSGPHGIINDASLDGGNYSNHGFVLGATLPASAVRILSAGADSGNVAALSYGLGAGTVYYSTIPLDYYLDAPSGQPAENLATVYTPNMLTYGDTLGDSSSSDWYSITLTAGTMVDFLTTTPGSGPFQPANGLDPHIELYSPAGVLVASGVDLADGRNEEIKYLPSTGGLYRIRITAEHGTTGEYFLDPIQVAPPAPQPRLLAAAPAPKKGLIRAANTRQPAGSLQLGVQRARQQAERLKLLDRDNVDALFGGGAAKARQAAWYSGQPQADVAESLLDLMINSGSRGKKASARSRR